VDCNVYNLSTLVLRVYGDKTPKKLMKNKRRGAWTDDKKYKQLVT